MPVGFAVSEVLFRLPVLGRVFRFALPIANYTDELRLSPRQRYRWAVLDTFDALSPAYDQPLRRVDLEEWLNEAGITGVQRKPGRALSLVGYRAIQPGASNLQVSRGASPQRG